MLFRSGEYLLDKPKDILYKFAVSKNLWQKRISIISTFTFIKYHKNKSNLGIPRNFLNVVSMADGDFVWLIGDDDLLMPNAIEELYKLINSHTDVDFFYVNSFHLTTEYLSDYPAPFDTANLPNSMVPFSKWSIALLIASTFCFVYSSL